MLPKVKLAFVHFFTNSGFGFNLEQNLAFFDRILSFLRKGVSYFCSIMNLDSKNNQTCGLARKGHGK